MCTMIADMTRGRTISARALLGATALSITLLASGCTKPVERDDARMATTPEQERSAPTQPAVRPQEASVEEKQKTPTVAAKQTAEPEPPVEQPAPLAPPAPVYTASELMGKSEDEVTILMGAPARVEQRAASTVWVYQGGDCGLDVFFFLDMATSDERVLTVAPTTSSASTAAPATAEAPAAGASAPAGEQSASATTADPAISEGTAVDACYGKLRRS
jgi:outer membrane biosynthesis protein TonB